MLPSISVSTTTVIPPPPVSAYNAYIQNPQQWATWGPYRLVTYTPVAPLPTLHLVMNPGFSYPRLSAIARCTVCRGELLYAHRDRYVHPH